MKKLNVGKGTGKTGMAIPKGKKPGTTFKKGTRTGMTTKKGKKG